MGLLSPAKASPTERWEDSGWIVLAHSEIGRVRTHLEDAWAVRMGERVAGRPFHALAVFDGLGGMPFGGQAARAAVKALPKTLRGATDWDGILPRLNDGVLPTGGMTTAVVALVPPRGGEGRLLAVGDSAAYALGPDRLPTLLAPKDSSGSHIVADCLGTKRPAGHSVPLSVGKNDSLLLCTDGVDGVLSSQELGQLLLAGPESLDAALQRAFQRILDLGAPDNATIVLARRTH